jgi:4-alpha-glucanotransferase
MKRSSGILLHPTSLPGSNSCGTLGKEAYRFVELLAETNQKWWQILPLNPPGNGDSPYQCFSAFAINPSLIDLDFLAEKKWITWEQAEVKNQNNFICDFNTCAKKNDQLLPSAYENFLREDNEELIKFKDFCDVQKEWLDDYAFFIAIKQHHSQLPWHQWPLNIRMRKPKTIKSLKDQITEEIELQKWIQYIAWSQWLGVKEYANKLGIGIIGDIPIYVSLDSSDVWTNPELFQLKEDGLPRNIAGVPPDYFSKTGQLWGNPLYNWSSHIQGNFSWWKKRVRSTLQTVDHIRLDHFRGFEAYWSVSANEKTAENGSWQKAPGLLLFETLQKEFNPLPFIAEDLGLITPEVVEMRNQFQLPGMKILQFAFDSDEKNDFRPHNYNRNTVVYTGTHDNDTVKGWILTSSEKDHGYAKSYLNSHNELSTWDFIRAAWASTADLSITTMQDILELNSTARMNTPGTEEGNWNWRFTWDQLQPYQKEWLKEFTIVYQRSK